MHLAFKTDGGTLQTMKMMNMKLSKLGIFALLLVSSLTIMVGTVIAPSLPEISKNLGFTNYAGWLITIPSLGVVLFAPAIGKLCDAKGPYTVMCWGLIPYGILGISGAFITNPIILITNRLFLGAATAAIQIAGTQLIAHFFKGNERMKIIAWQGMAIEIGGVIFLSLGGILGGYNWQYPFFIYGVAFLGLGLVTKYIPGSNSTPKASVTKATAAPQKKIAVIVSCALFSMILFFVAFVNLPEFLPKYFDFTEANTGYFMAFISLVAVTSASQMPKISHYLGAGTTVALGFLLFMAGYLSFYMAHSVALLIIAALFTGMGFALTVPLLNHMTLEESTSESRGYNLGLYSVGIFGGQFLSSFLGLAFKDVHSLFMVTAGISLTVAGCAYIAFSKLAQVHKEQ